MKKCYKNKISCAVLILCLFLVNLTGCEWKDWKKAEPVEKGVLKVGMNLSIPSMCELSEETNKPEGFEVEIAGKLAEKMGLKLEIMDTSEENLLKSLDAELYDCVISAVGIAEWNESHYSRTAAYADISSVKEETGLDTEFTRIAVFTRRNNPMVKDLDGKLQELKNSGSLTEISQKYFSRDIIVK